MKTVFIKYLTPPQNFNSAIDSFPFHGLIFLFWKIKPTFRKSICIWLLHYVGTTWYRVVQTWNPKLIISAASSEPSWHLQLKIYIEKINYYSGKQNPNNIIYVKDKMNWEWYVAFSQNITLKTFNLLRLYVEAFSAACIIVFNFFLQAST